MTGNLLAHETSPYLLQHADNPVHWRAWGPEALAEAKADNKPILLSVGYAACHWCHVMAHESFEDEDTAALMNANFVNVKVDREERPDIDAIYQTALALLGEHGGWPLTMFLTPRGEPFWGGTYFPPAPRFGRPAFRDVLKAVRDVYDNEQDKVAHNATALRDALENLSRPTPGESIAPDFLRRAAARLVQEVDPVHGGLGHAPKFPQVPLFEMMWRGWKETGNDQLADAVTRTLDHMSLGGIYDHLGGGFARYATDAAWLVPHFEKMLYDNAQLVDLFTLVWQETRSPLYAARIEETIGWALRDMLVDGAAFASSFDADSEGKEGAFYTWTADEIDRLLGDDAPAFKEAYGVTAGGNWEGVNILHRRTAPGADPALEDRLARCRETLWRAREARPKPLRDDKVLADWNGLMIRALANAGAVFGKPRWIDAAARAFAFVADTMADGARLRHAWRAGQAKHTGTLDDYASMARAAVALYEATGDDDYLARAERWVDTADRHFRDAESGGYFFTADDAEDLITRTKTAVDGAAPSGNAMMTEVLARLYHITGRQAYRERAESVIAAFAGEVPSRFFLMGALVNAHALLDKGVEIVIVGPRGAAETAALIDAVHGAALPDRVLALLEPGASLPRDHPAHGKDQAGDQPTAYVCRRGTCSPPVTDPLALKEQLAQA